MKYFSVKAKCGHVGKDYYYEGEFFIEAENASEAAMTARLKPRVKHHHKDAILSVIQVTYQEYEMGQIDYFSNPYFKCKSRKEQDLIIDRIRNKIFPELDKAGFQKSNADRLSKLELLRKWQRKSCKHSSYLMEA